MLRTFSKLLIPSLFVALVKSNQVAIGNQKHPLEIPTGKCNQMEKSVTLKLSSTESKKLIDGFMDSPFINCLTLEANNINEISPGAFKLLPNLYFLNLARNFLPVSKLISFDAHQKLRTLIVDENLADKKEGTLTVKSKFSNLQYLYARRNRISNLTTTTTTTTEMEEKLPNLTHFYLEDNIMEEMIIFPPKLTHLNLGRNRLKKFNATRVPSIENLELNENGIKVICNAYCHEFFLSLDGARNLSNLSLAGNEVNNLEPDSFDDTINLLHLDLSDNKIELIRKGTFNSLSKLENLLLNRNLLQSLPDFSALQHLRNLNMSENKIKTIFRGEFKNFAYLKSLSLSGNSLQTIEIESFTNLMSLEILDLSMNKLEHLPINWLTGVENLETLDLRGNCFQNFASLSLGYMESLRIIFLQNNPLMFVNTRAMSNFPKSVSIHLKNEYPVKCLVNLEILSFHAKTVETLKTGKEFQKIPTVQKIV